MAPTLEEGLETADPDRPGRPGSAEEEEVFGAEVQAWAGLTGISTAALQGSGQDIPSRQRAERMRWPSSGRRQKISGTIWEGLKRGLQKSKIPDQPAITLQQITGISCPGNMVSHFFGEMDRFLASLIPQARDSVENTTRHILCLVK